MEKGNLKSLIDRTDYDGIETALINDPGLANAGIPFDEVNTTKAHPLHRICDGVFSGKFTDEAAVKMATLFLDHGADINGGPMIKKADTPLLAAASLSADQVALLYIDRGADINHAGCHGGTALHWAAWCGRDKVVRRLIQEGAAINKLCIDYKATPLFWAIHGWKNGDENNRHNQVECVKILVQSGADKAIPNGQGKTVFDLLGEEDVELKELLSDIGLSKEG